MTEPTYPVGARVRVKALYPPGHVRTPSYCRGRTGVVERYLGTFPNPEQLAYQHPKPERLPLYRIRFSEPELWESYEGGDGDVLELELYEPWLEPAEEKAP